MPEHKDLTGANLHEPKDVATANVDEVYVADGAGSGAWQRTLIGVHGEMVIQSNTTAEVTPTAVDTTLSTDSDYTKIITGWSAGHLQSITFNVDELVLPYDGDYFITAWADILLPANNQRVGIKYAINDTTPYSVRKLVGTSAAAGDIVNVAGTAFIGAATAGNTVSLYIATDKAGDPTVLEGGICAFMMHEL